MNKNEFAIIRLALKKRITKEIKEIKKLYQASIDGDSVRDFHNKCDNIPNTLVIIKSSGNRRFGGFTSETWESCENCKYKYDKNAFLFSLDKQKIYICKNSNRAIYCNINYGPSFGNEISIQVNSIIENYLFTYESNIDSSYDFYGDNNALSDGNGKSTNALELEVFQIIFN